MLNCKLGELPIKYLGIPVSDKVLSIGAFQGLPAKMVKRLDPWKGKFMTSGGKLILTNSCLSNLPMYVMGFYMLPRGCIKRWILSDPNSSGKGLGTNLSITWLNG